MRGGGGPGPSRVTPCTNRRILSEAEIIRQGIHLAAMANRVWDEREPLFSRTFAGPGRALAKGEVRDAVADTVKREAGTGAEPEPESEGSVPDPGSAA
ncbi:hypothetical protein ACIBKX_22960 [Streptomyces sp. NPDC050658]|uniref:hypothetical protein n=1 Tax=Streptomyces sp. NPDC050658 TaxID=3365633 RepID=UPI003792EFEF